LKTRDELDCRPKKRYAFIICDRERPPRLTLFSNWLFRPIEIPEIG
jgi:hypothetical protein